MTMERFGYCGVWKFQGFLPCVLPVFGVVGMAVATTIAIARSKSWAWLFTRVRDRIVAD
jgi:hypothetical protein